MAHRRIFDSYYDAPWHAFFEFVVVLFALRPPSCIIIVKTFCTDSLYGCTSYISLFASTNYKTPAAFPMASRTSPLQYLIVRPKINPFQKSLGPRLSLAFSFPIGSGQTNQITTP